MAEALCDQLFSDVDGELMMHHPPDADDLLGILEAWEDCVTGGGGSTPRAAEVPQSIDTASPPKQQAAGNVRRLGDRDDATVPAPKRRRCSPAVSSSDAAATSDDGAANNKTSHITVERNRRKQMNEHLAVLRSLMPCFYVKRGDQASIIGGVVDYIKELQQVLQSLEAKKQRKAYTDQVLSPRPPPACCSPRPPLSPLPPLPPLKSTPPISPRPSVAPISPRTPPGPGSPYKVRRKPPLPLPLSPPGSAYASPARTPTREPSPASSSYLPSLDKIAAELCAYAANGTNKQQRQALLPAAAGGGAVLLPDVRVEFSGANLVVKTVSHRAPGQAVKVIAALEGRSLEILDAKISTVDDTAVNSFTIKIGIECELSAEELVQEIQQAFS
ncbi:transcription factor SPEECHLESS-like [Panicum miliaceum]|uniref:Transcription factor SPEECHLESS-like n=1 Tax=Panicum miliaceum TaxID=4540 RepID=A0A3L6S1I8_PANMI|nr:transcription factor SPEECHLESS-like [Panicum miliaceum]